MSRAIVGMLWVVALLPEVSAAQMPQALMQGERVRIAHRCVLARDQVVECRDTPSPRYATGEVQGFDADIIHLRVTSSDTELAIPMGSVSQVWVSDGTRGRFWTGAGSGLLAGAVGGAIIGSTQDFCLLECGPATAFGVIIGAPVGALLGGVVGATIRSERWRAVPRDGLQMSLAPRREAIGLTVSVAF